MQGMLIGIVAGVIGIPWDSTTGVFDRVRSPAPDGVKLGYFSIEIDDSSGRVFSETDLDNKTTTAVLNSTGTTMTISKGSDGDAVFGFIEDISEDGAVADVLVAGITEPIAYAAATEDPDVGNSVLSKGDGKVKQTPTATDIAAGGQTDGQGYVLWKDTSATTVRLRWP